MLSDFSLDRNTVHRNAPMTPAKKGFSSSNVSHQCQKTSQITVTPPISDSSLDYSHSLRNRRYRVYNEPKPRPKLKIVSANLERQNALCNPHSFLQNKRSHPISAASTSANSQSSQPLNTKRVRVSNEESGSNPTKKAAWALKEIQVPVREELISKFNSTRILNKILKNRAFALAQQAQEKSKGFTVDNQPFPWSIKVKTPSYGMQVMPIQVVKGELNGRKFGIACCQGRRDDMEDNHIAEIHSFKVRDQQHPFEVYGVFDGHGGKTASKFVKSLLPHFLTKALETHNQEALTDDGIYQALQTCCKDLDRAYLGIGGTTLIMYVIIKEKIWVANVGDSRAILVKDEEGVQASEDAKPEMARYLKTILKLGGDVTFFDKAYRVNGILSVARAIGDKYIVGETKECCISPNPKTAFYLIDDYKNGYLVIACDGLYNVATTNEVAHAIATMDKWGESVENMGSRLVYQAIKKGSGDNVTVIVIKL